jgi:hypothetical protein
VEVKKNRPRAVIGYHDDPSSITLEGDADWLLHDLGDLYLIRSWHRHGR